MRDSSGTSAVEFALIAVPFTTILLGGVEGGRLVWSQNTLQHATELAARCAQVDTVNCADDAAVKKMAAGYASAVGATEGNFSVAREDCGIKVSSSYQFNSVSLIPFSTQITASYCRPN